MSANDILDVLNVQRDDSQPAKKRQKVDQPSLQKGSMARELYNLIGPNTPPVSINLGGKRDRRQRVSPWTRMPFVPNKKSGNSATFHHWEKGSKELLESAGQDREYFFDKFLVAIDIPELVDEPTYDSIMAEIKEQEREKKEERERQRRQKSAKEGRDKEKDGKGAGEQKNGSAKRGDSAKSAETVVKREKDQKTGDPKKDAKEASASRPGSAGETAGASSSGSEKAGAVGQKSTENGQDKESEDSSADPKAPMTDTESAEVSQTTKPVNEPSTSARPSNSGPNAAPDHDKPPTDLENTKTPANPHDSQPAWTYEETQLLFQFCRDFELKWHIINDRFPAHLGRTMEDLKEHFYRVSAKILKYKGTGNPSLLESLDAFSKTAEIDRKQYLESLLKRTPAEIAEEESLVIEARRFELAAKKMLTERTNLLSLLDSPQSSSVQQYLSSQGLTNLYNNLMILDKHQKKKMQQKSMVPADPIPPPIPSAASSSHKRDRSFQTHLQQYLAGVLKSQPQQKGEPNPIQQLLAKRLTTKEEEAYGLVYHANERLTPNVILRSTQKLSGLQQRQSVFKAVNNMLQELDIPTAGGTTWKPNMPTRKTMAKYDEMVKSVVALLDVKKGKDKLEAEIELIKSQRGLQ